MVLKYHVLEELEVDGTHRTLTLKIGASWPRKKDSGWLTQSPELTRIFFHGSFTVFVTRIVNDLVVFLQLTGKALHAYRYVVEAANTFSRC